MQRQKQRILKYAGFLSVLLVSFTAESSSTNETTLSSISFLSSNFKSCSGKCEKENIKCDQNSSEHGSFHWCKENCVSPTKTDLHKYQEGLKSCHEEKETVNVSPGSMLSVSSK